MKGAYKSAILIFSALFLFFLSSQSQTAPEVKELTYRAYTLGKIDLWKEALVMAESNFQESGCDSALHDVVMVQYAYISFCIAEGYKKEGRELLSSAYENIEKIETGWWQEADLLAINASLAALELNLYPQKMMKLVPLALELTDQAYETDNNNYMALACKANMLNFTPKMFGGSPTEAIPLYKKIITLYETNQEDATNNWRYVSTLVTLAGTYENLNMYKEACKVYEQIIEFDNNINWINTKLYPDCKANLLKQK
mgnify:CR=1 FL=1